MLFSGTNSGTALAVAKVAKEKKRVYINNGAGSSALTNDQCSPYTIHYAYDTVALAKGTGGAVVEQRRQGLVLPDRGLRLRPLAGSRHHQGDQGQRRQREGQRAPSTERSDFSTFLLQAQNSKAQILGLANAGGDTINAIKAAREFGINKSMKMAGLLVFLTDIHSLGLKNTEGLLLTTSWDWNLNDETRAFGQKFLAKTKRMPTDIQAANYSATINYLKAVRNGRHHRMRTRSWPSSSRTPLKDFYAEGVIRPDGRFAHDMYLMQVKSPSESKEALGLLQGRGQAARRTRCGPPRPRASARCGSDWTDAGTGPGMAARRRAALANQSMKDKGDSHMKAKFTASGLVLDGRRPDGCDRRTRRRTRWRSVSSPTCPASMPTWRARTVRVAIQMAIDDFGGKVLGKPIELLSGRPPEQG